MWRRSAMMRVSRKCRFASIGGSAEGILTRFTVRDPLRLCRFLHAKCVERGVYVHLAAHAVSLVTGASASNLVTGIQIEDLNKISSSTIPCTSIVFAAGAWTQRAFSSLFPASTLDIHVSSLSGYSLLLRSPRHTMTHEQEKYEGKSHAVFTTHPRACGFSPEIFSRAGAEIYIAGLNSSDIPLPEFATDTRNLIEKEKTALVRWTAVALMGGYNPNPSTGSDTSTEPSVLNDNIDDLEIVREGLCFRPWTASGLPIVSRVPSSMLDTSNRMKEVGDGVFVATGHGPWGITLSLGTGKVVAEMISGLHLSANISGLGF